MSFIKAVRKEYTANIISAEKKRRATKTEMRFTFLFDIYSKEKKPACFGCGGPSSGHTLECRLRSSVKIMYSCFWSGNTG